VLAGENDNAALSTIFYGSIPYWLLMLVVMILIAVNPSVASWLTTFI
jgi:TRAP-type mannitol/chloroaromatic compound transport system permease large subunit